jgi:hypothetical protein
MYTEKQYNNSLCHFGVKGMHWGVRRYQNYDGKYTQAGLARYNESVTDYKNAKKKYKEMKSEGGHTTHELKTQKGKIKYAKNQGNRRYELLKQDKLADKGKIRYQYGERIRNNNKITRNIETAAGVALSAGSMMITNPTKINKFLGLPNISTVGITKLGKGLSAGGAIAGAIAIGKSYVDHRNNKQISAYYNHSYKR